MSETNCFGFLASQSLLVPTYSAVRLAGEVLGSNQAGEEEGDSRGLHCEDGLFVCFWCLK